MGCVAAPYEAPSGGTKGRGSRTKGVARVVKSGSPGPRLMARMGTRIAQQVRARLITLTQFFSRSVGLARDQQCLWTPEKQLHNHEM